MTNGLRFSVLDSGTPVATASSSSSSTSLRSLILVFWLDAQSNWMRHNDLASSIDEPILSAVIPSSPLFSSLSCSSSEASLSSSSEKKRKKSESFDYTWLDEHDEVDDLANAFAFTAVESSHA